MADVDRFRDSTQILLPATALDGIRDELETRFTLTVRQEGPQVRIIGSPWRSNRPRTSLAMNGVTLA